MKNASNDSKVRRGDPEFPGARIADDGVNFAVQVPEGQEAALVLADRKGRERERIPLPEAFREGEVAAVYVQGLEASSFGYYYEIGGKRTPDPAARMIRDDGLCFAVDPAYPWPDERKADIRPEELIIYKLHVRGFTKKAPGDLIRHRGTFAGVEEALPYILDLGFTAIELMPVYDFDPELKIQPFSSNLASVNGKARALPARNYWGYSEKSRYFAPKASYAAGADPVAELRSMVHACHEAGIAVFMEMYFPGGTDPFFAMQVVRWWRSAYRMDGFHFIGDGTPYTSLVRDPLLAKTALFFERVDSHYIYGSRIPGTRHILEYNEDFMHTGRRLLKGDEGQMGDFAWCIRRNPATNGRVNYMANVNGFTLMDAVSYDWKHNEENGEGNQDGPVNNDSWNCGTEGPTRKKAVRSLRLRQVRNALAYVFLSQSTPLILAGDECGNTQKGNNNAYSSDNPTGWTDWNRTKEGEELRLFVKELIALRKAHPILHMAKELKGTDYRSAGFPDISFHDSEPWTCSFENSSRTLAVMYCGLYTREEKGCADDFLYAAFNAGWDEHEFALPALPASYRWFKDIDTAEAPSPDGISGTGLLADQRIFTAAPRSVVVIRGIQDEDPVGKSVGASEDDHPSS